MKTTKTILCMLLAGFLITACQNDDEQSVPSPQNGETMTVNFDIDASNIRHEISSGSSLLKYTPTYTTAAFNIYAFKKEVDGNDFKFEKIINTTGWKNEDSNKKISGKDELRIGTYKFLIGYGLNQSNILSLPTWSQSLTLSNDFRIGYSGSGAMQEVFLTANETNMDALETYPLGLTDDPNKTVTASLKRAVSRVDILFIKASKDDNGVYTEQPYNDDEDALGKFEIDQFQLRFTNLKNSMDFFGLNTTGNESATINLGNFAQTITFGTGAQTVVGTNGFTEFDNIRPSNIIKGGAHVYGTFLFPNADGTPTAGLSIYIKPKGGEGRLISLNNNKLPLERNKVTLVKVYVLDDEDDNDDDDDPNVFTTTVNFEVEVITAWDGHHEVIGEVD